MIESYQFTPDQLEVSKKWWDKLEPIQQSGLKKEAYNIWGLGWISVRRLFSHDEAVCLLYEKLKIDGII